MEDRASEIIERAMKKAHDKGITQELVRFVTGFSRLERMELFGVATLLRVPLNKGAAAIDKDGMERLREVGLGDEFNFLMEKNDLKGMDELLVDIINAFILETPERQNNICALIEEARGER